MKNKITHFLLISIACVFALCICVFSIMAVLMNRRGATAVGELGA